MNEDQKKVLVAKIREAQESWFGWDENHTFAEWAKLGPIPKSPSGEDRPPAGKLEWDVWHDLAVPCVSSGFATVAMLTGQYMERVAGFARSHANVAIDYLAQGDRDSAIFYLTLAADLEDIYLGVRPSKYYNALCYARTLNK